MSPDAKRLVSPSEVFGRSPGTPAHVVAKLVGALFWAALILLTTLL